ncbi:MAG: hypothetical protein BRD45_03305 [Bacteroidetes bacterium QS_8_64_10]|nr:MAG: hypothetical protein BRD45_03305 [Bacteroidetes bacterium QS_8_64_10]
MRLHLYMLRNTFYVLSLAMHVGAKKEPRIRLESAGVSRKLTLQLVPPMMQEVVSPKRMWASLLCSAVALMVGASPSLAQQGDASSFLQSAERKQQRSWEAMQMSSGLAVPLEGQVDPSAYVVGPGDVFSVFVGGPEPVNLTPTVSAEGDLVLPEVGSLPAADHTLAEVKQAAQSALRESFQNVSLDVSLQRPRTFFVHASGAVHRSGRYTANPVTRVSNVIERAVVDTLPDPVRNPDFEPSFRNITLIRQDGDRQSVDLERYFATGNPEYNPYLRDGDVISVPTYRPDVRSVRVDGNVPFADTYAYRPGDTVLDLLAIATGESPPENVERVRLTRQGGNDAADTRMLDVSALISGEREPVPLRPLDHLSVPGGAQSSSGRATVRGSVKYPGTYRIKSGRTTAEDLVEQAGGLRAASRPTAQPRTHRGGSFSADAFSTDVFSADAFSADAPHGAFLFRAPVRSPRTEPEPHSCRSVR